MSRNSQNQPDNHSPEDLLAQAIRSIEHEAVPPGPPADLVASTLRSLSQCQQSAEQPAPAPAPGGVLKIIATAASLLFATSLAAALLPVIQSGSTAFADVFSQALQQVRGGQSMSYQQQLTIQGKPGPITTRQSIAADGRRRSEVDGYVTIYDRSGQARVTLIEPTHVAIVSQGDEGPELGPSKSLLDWLRHLQDLGDKPDQELGMKELDGKQATGFLATRENLTFTMWIDTASGKPVRVEYDCTVGDTPAHVVMSDFQFPETLDERSFNVGVPAGYEIYGQPAIAKVEPARGLELAWSHGGTWSSLAGAIARPSVFGLQFGGLVVELDSGGEQISAIKIDDEATALRTARLTSDQGDQLLTFRILGPKVEAHAAGGTLLWTYGPGDGESTWAINDVAVADLDRDGIDEVIIGGSAGLQVLNASGQLLWTALDQGRIWHVAAGDVDGNARPEVLATSSTGKVLVFDVEGNQLRNIDPGFYAQSVAVCGQAEVVQARLEAALGRRNALAKRLREQELQLLLVGKNQSAKSAVSPSEDAIEAELEKDAMIAELAIQTGKLRRAIAQQQTLADGPRAALGSLHHQIAQVEGQMKARRQILQAESLPRLIGGDVDLALPDPAQIETLLPLLKDEREALDDNLAKLTEELEKLVKEYARFDRETADLENRETKLDDLKTIIKRISYQLSLWNLEHDAEQRIRVMDEAVRPTSDDTTQRDLLSIAFGTAAFLVAGFLLAVLVHLHWSKSVPVAVVVGGLAALVAWRLVPVSYEAQSLIKVSKVLPVVIQNVQNGGVDEGASFDIFKKTQVQWAKSPFVLNRAARRPEMVKLATMKEHREDPAGFLGSKIVVDFPGDAEVMRVSMKGTHREDLPVIVNSVVASYMEEIVTGDKMARLKQRDLLAKHLSENQEQYRELAAGIHQLAEQMNANSSEQAQMRKRLINQQLDSLMASRSALLQRIRDIELRIRLLEKRQAQKGGAAPPATDPRLEIQYADDPVLAGLGKQLDTLRASLKGRLNRAAPADDRFNRHAKARQLAQLEQQLEKRKRELLPDVVARLVGEQDAIQDSTNEGGTAAMTTLMRAQRDVLEHDLARADKELEIAMQEVSQPAAVIVVSGTGNRKVPLAAVDGQGKRLWSTELSSAATSAVASTSRPWLAVAASDGSIGVVDLTSGAVLGQLDAAGADSDVAWLSDDDGKPLLIVTQNEKLSAYHLSVRWSAEQP